MNRYLHTLRIFWSASISAEMEYRANFVMATLNSMMTLAGALFTLFLFYRTGYEMGGWSWPEALVVVGMFTTLEGMQETFLMPNRTQVTEMVREGTLDFVLLKPIDSQFWLSVRKLSVWGIPNIFIGLVTIIYAGTRMEQMPGALAYLSAMVPLALGVIALYSLGYILSTLTIWFIKLFNITMAMQSLLETGRYPITAYPTAYQVFFTFVLPVAFMTTVPAQSVVGRQSAAWLLGAVVVASGLLLTSRWFWHFALRYYTSASS